MKNKSFYNWIVTLFILSFPISLFADDDIDPHPTDDDPLPGAPIDTALIYLIIMPSSNQFIDYSLLTYSVCIYCIKLCVKKIKHNKKHECIRNEKT